MVFRINTFEGAAAEHAIVLCAQTLPPKEYLNFFFFFFDSLPPLPAPVTGNVCENYVCTGRRVGDFRGTTEFRKFVFSEWRVAFVSPESEPFAAVFRAYLPPRILVRRHTGGGCGGRDRMSSYTGKGVAKIFTSFIRMVP